MTTLVSADVSGTDLTYTNSLSIGAEELGADFGALQRDVLKDLVCENKDMMVTINHGGSFTYKYIDQDGRLVASIDITKRDCGG